MVYASPGVVKDGEPLCGGGLAFTSLGVVKDGDVGVPAKERAGAVKDCEGGVSWKIYFRKKILVKFPSLGGRSESVQKSIFGNFLGNATLGILEAGLSLCRWVCPRKGIHPSDEPSGKGFGKGVLGVVKDGPMVGVSVKPTSGLAKDEPSGRGFGKGVLGVVKDGPRVGVSAKPTSGVAREEPSGGGFGKGALGVVKDGPMVGVSVKPKSGVAKDEPRPVGGGSVEVP